MPASYPTTIPTLVTSTLSQAESLAQQSRMQVECFACEGRMILPSRTLVLRKDRGTHRRDRRHSKLRNLGRASLRAVAAGVHKGAESRLLQTCSAQLPIDERGLHNSRPRIPTTLWMFSSDFMSEGNMAALAARKAQGVSAYEFVFVDAINLALADIAKYGIKVVVNAGTSDTELLHGVVVDLVKSINLLSRSRGSPGDEVFPAILEPTKADPQAFLNVHTGEPLSAWPFKPFYAQACLGRLGVAAALQHGADIVICGRVSDPSLVVGAAAWWHNWGSRTR
ncbi:hypothetical protein DFH08DRAFT_987925 [Mycena albidolilacea]|uniref:Acyclic terpene utilisation N-terminal domain-containing protein n=1 Tax=Mycena albidolilacea TaxID=1033008 RepID=A0AAD7EWD4_9AGAR|nr:hypothetical protein DFH08DRAFT_987925 [Mycena albidolilacea]